MKGKTVIVLSTVFMALLMAAAPVNAAQFSLGGDREVDLLGSLSNQVQVGVAGDHYDTMPGFQQWLTSFQLMMDFNLSQNLSAYLSGIATIDWAYDIYHDNDDWNEKLFDQSRDNLYLDDEWWQLLGEAHFTYTPGNFFFRLGKQIVKWGELESIGVFDQINPKDYRRGVGDVEFETYNIAVPMVRAEFWPGQLTSIFTATNLQFLFIPNMDFIATQPESPYDIYYGNDVGGIYSANAMLDLTDLGLGMTRVGHAEIDLEEPDGGDSENFEYGLKFSTQIGGNILSLMGFKGKANSAVYNYDYESSNIYFPLPIADDSFTQTDTDDIPIVYPLIKGFYPDQEYAAASLSSELSFLKLSAIGGSAPLLRIESLYEFDKTFADENFADDYIEDLFTTGVPNFDLLDDAFVESDQWVNGISLEQKIKLGWLQKSYFTFAVEYTHREIMDHDQNWSFEDTNETVSFYAETSYFRGTIVPAYWFIRYIDDEIDLHYPGIYYFWSNNLNFYAGAGFFGGDGAESIENKDYAVFKVNYNF